MKVHLISGGIIEVEGNLPALQKNGLMRFDFLDTTLPMGWDTASKVTKDPLIPIANIERIER